MIYDLIVIGAGACGLVCAITAKRRNKSVLIFEKEKKAGSKILVSGNGKCNLSATDVCPEKYNDPEFVRDVLSEEPLKFFSSVNVMTRTVGKRIYPYSESALTVVNNLRACLSESDFCYEEVTAISFEKGLFTVGSRRARNVALCSGSAATKGKSSYDLVKKFGHVTTPLTPSIVQLRTDTSFIKGLSGIKSKARVSLLCDEKKVAVEEGEILFRDTGLSGIAVMCLSVFIARHPNGAYRLSVDFIPDSYEESKFFIRDGKADGIVHKAVAQAVERYAKVKGVALSDALTDFRLPVVGLGPFSQAQVTCGGLKTDDFDNTLQSRLRPGLYAGGEVLDVDGECGGYNLHWAFCCGLRIGKSIE